MHYLYDFTDFLASLSTEQGIALGLLGLLVFLIAYCIGWLVGRRKVVRMRKQLELATRENKQYQERLQANEEEQKSLARELVRLTTEKDEVLVQLQQAQTTSTNLQQQLTALQASHEEVQVTNQSYATTIEDLNDQVIGLKTRNEHLLNGGGGAAGDEQLSEANSLTERVAALEEQLARLGSLPATEQQEEPILVNTGRSGHAVIIGTPYAATTDDATREKPTDGDDLTRIHTIGPFNERKLHEAGVTQYAQLAEWDDQDIDSYAARIGYVADLIREEDWVGQARRLSATSSDT